MYNQFHLLTFWGFTMKRFLLAGVAVVALVGAASAADIYRKAPPPVAPVAPPPPAFSWTGCFVGAHWGWGWGRKDLDEHFTSDITFGGVRVVTFADDVASNTLDTSGGIFGGQVGCDYQFGFGKGAGLFGNWVIGIQADIAGADINGFGTDPIGAAFFPESASVVDRIAVKTDFLSSVTGRLGVTIFPQSLLYVKGGVAWAHDRWDLHGAFNNLALSFGGTRRLLAGTTEVDETRTGWTVGVGAEWAFMPNWSAWVEWDHYDFGTRTLLDVSASVPLGGGFFFNQTDFLQDKQRIETVKIGVNYRFNLFGVGKGKAPVVARY